MRQGASTRSPRETLPVPASQTTTTRSVPCGHDGRRTLRRAGLSWLTGVLVLLLALTLGEAPAQHARTVLARASEAVAVAQIGAGDHGHGKPASEHHGHLLAPACFACVLMAAPGLPANPSVAIGRVVVAEAAFQSRSAIPARPGTAWSPQRARAPPSDLPA